MELGGKKAPVSNSGEMTTPISSCWPGRQETIAMATSGSPDSTDAGWTFDQVLVVYVT